MKVFLDDEWEQPDRYPGDSWICVRTVEDARFLLVRNRGKVTHLSLDHDLGTGEFEGHHLTRWLLESLNEEPSLDFYPTEEISIHSQNPVGKAAMEADLLHRSGKPHLYRRWRQPSKLKK